MDGGGPEGGLVDAQSAQSLACLAVGEREEGVADVGAPVVGPRLQASNPCDKGGGHLHQVALAVGGSQFIDHVVGRSLLLHGEVDAPEAVEAVHVVGVHLSIFRHAEQQAGLVNQVHIAAPLALQVDFLNAEEALVLRLGGGVVLDALVLRRPILQYIVKCKHICVVFDFYAKDTAAPLAKWDKAFFRAKKRPPRRAVYTFIYIIVSFVFKNLFFEFLQIFMFDGNIVVSRCLFDEVVVIAYFGCTSKHLFLGGRHNV